jgi:hypothetical protein
MSDNTMARERSYRNIGEIRVVTGEWRARHIIQPRAWSPRPGSRPASVAAGPLGANFSTTALLEHFSKLGILGREIQPARASLYAARTAFTRL